MKYHIIRVSIINSEGRVLTAWYPENEFTYDIKQYKRDLKDQNPGMKIALSYTEKPEII